MVDVIVNITAEAAAADVAPMDLQAQLNEAVAPLAANMEMYNATKRLFVLAGIDMAEGTTPAEMAAHIGAHVAKQQQQQQKKAVKAKAVRAPRTKAVKGAAGGVKGAKKVKADKPKRGPTNYLVFFNLMRSVYAAAHPDWSTLQLGAHAGQEWKAMGDEDKAKYTELAKAQGEIIAHGGLAIKWPGAEAASTLPVDDLLDLWRTNLAAIVNDRTRLSEWTSKSLRAMLARFYGAELIATHKDALKGIIRELVGVAPTDATA